MESEQTSGKDEQTSTINLALKRKKELYLNIEDQKLREHFLFTPTTYRDLPI